VKYSSLVCGPLFIFPDESYPEIFIFYFDKFNSCVGFLWEIDVVSGVFMSGSVVFKVCFAFNVCWEIILLSPVNSLVLFESSDKYYCHQDVTGVCPVFQGRLGKA